MFNIYVFIETSIKRAFQTTKIVTFLFTTLVLLFLFNILFCWKLSYMKIYKEKFYDLHDLYGNKYRQLKTNKPNFCYSTSRDVCGLCRTSINSTTTDRFFYQHFVACLSIVALLWNISPRILSRNLRRIRTFFSGRCIAEIRDAYFKYL